MPARALFCGLAAVQIACYCPNAVAEDSRDPATAPAEVMSASVTGPSGGLAIPSGTVLPDGTMTLLLSNYLDPRFNTSYTHQNYVFGIGFLPYLEVSGRIANYLGTEVRDISANVKLALPKFFDWQPDIAIGDNDVGGNAQFFHSKYIVASQHLDTVPFINSPMTLSLGGASGQSSLNGLIGGVELGLRHTRLSVLAETSNKTGTIGLRYTSLPVPMLANASLVASVQRSIRAIGPDGSNANHTTMGISVVVPFGSNAHGTGSPVIAASSGADHAYSADPAYSAYSADLADLADPATALPAATTSSGSVVSAGRINNPEDAVAGYRYRPEYDAAVNAIHTINAINAANAVSAARADTDTDTDTSDGRELQFSTLQALQNALVEAGLERVRVGASSNTLVIEYENHRYNQNEVDAIGIALGLGARAAPPQLERVSVITKKAGLTLYQTSVERAPYLQFLHDGLTYPVQTGMRFTLRPSDHVAVTWLDGAETGHGYSRVKLAPVLATFVATEYGMFDYSLALTTQVVVPLWKGAELSANYLHTLSESSQVNNGIFSFAHQPSGVQSAALNHTFWVTDGVLNTTSLGKFMADYKGIQNETTLFMPYNDDQARLEYSRLSESSAYQSSKLVYMGGFYRWTYQPTDTWVELGYNKYVQNDRGPSVTVSRWFDNVEASLFARRSNLATYVGFQLSFPLTPRQGMRPGLSHLEGSSHFGYGLSTKLGTNYIVPGITQQIPMIYSAEDMLLNQRRIGIDYFVSQLPHMREALFLFSPAISPSPQSQTNPYSRQYLNQLPTPRQAESPPSSAKGFIP